VATFCEHGNERGFFSMTLIRLLPEWFLRYEFPTHEKKIPIFGGVALWILGDRY
jgi:hypothetical protein